MLNPLREVARAEEAIRLRLADVDGILGLQLLMNRCVKL